MALITRFAWAFGFAGTLALIGGASAWFALGTLTGPATWLWVLGTVLLIAWVALDRHSLSDAVSTRSFALSSGSVAMQVVAALLAVVGFIVIDERLDTTFDLTDQGVHSLSGHTLEVLEGIDAPIEVLAFFEDGTAEGLAFGRLVELYTQAQPELQLVWIDPLAQPARAQAAEVVGPTVILRQGDREERLDVDFGETNLTRRLVLVQTDVEHEVCWSTGHGETDPDDDVNPDGYGAAVLALEGVNVQVLNTVVATQGIPRSCEALVIARPQADWLPFEREALAAYVAEGGQVLVLVDPLAHTPGFTADLERFALQVFDDVVFDADPTASLAGMEGTVALFGDRVLSHPVTDPLGAAVILPVARSVGFTQQDGIFAQELLRTSQLGWGETDLDDPMGPPVADPGVDRTGQLPLAVLAEIVNPAVLDVQTPSDGPAPVDGAFTEDLGRMVPTDFTPKPGGRVLVVGDADFPSNQALTVGANQDFFLNTVVWMLGEEEQLGERPKPAEPLDLTGFGSAMLCLTSVVFVPGTAVLFAIFTLLRRRRL